MMRISLSILCLLALPTWGQKTGSSRKRPNILFIMSDDHTTQAIGAYGGRLAALNPTPTIDTLAESGMRFDRVFCNNSICTPSRASIMTGQYPQTNGVLDLRGSLPPEQQFLAIEMGKAGYETAMIGKWHLKKEPAAFDYYSVLPGQGKYHNPSFRVRGPKTWPQNSITKKGQHSSDAITDLSLAWLRDQRDKTKPFFLMHHFKAPHDMFSHAKRYDSYLDREVIPEPANLLTSLKGSPGSTGLGSGLSKSAPWKLGKRLGIGPDLPEPTYTKATYQTYLKHYLRCVKGVDDNIKRLLEFLEETGELQNTLIIYTGDQGFFLGEHNLMDKRWIYEEAMRMPFIVSWPREIKAGTNNDWLINNTDFAPTLLELAGLPKKPAYMQGRSFALALQSKPQPSDWRPVTYYRYWMHLAHNLAVPGHFGVRSPHHKLVFFYGTDEQGSSANRTPPSWEFYDLKKDPHEMDNKYHDPAYQNTIAALKTHLWKARERLNETDQKNLAIEKIVRSNR